MKATPYNIATVIFLVLTVLVTVAYCLIAVGVLDPFPPPPTATLIPTWTPVPVTDTPVPTWTFTLTMTPKPTLTPSDTPPPSPTPTLPAEEAEPSDTPGAWPTATTSTGEGGDGGEDDDEAIPLGEQTPVELPTFPPGGVTPTPEEVPPTESGNPAAGDYPFVAKEEEISFIKQYLYEAEGCDWQGVAGKVFGLAGEELTQNLLVHVFGNGVNAFVEVGSNTNYGASGWEQFLSDTINDSKYYLQLLDGETRQQLSDVVRLTFPNTCEGNLAVVYFQQVEKF